MGIDKDSVNSEIASTGLSQAQQDPQQPPDITLSEDHLLTFKKIIHSFFPDKSESFVIKKTKTNLAYSVTFTKRTIKTKQHHIEGDISYQYDLNSGELLDLLSNQLIPDSRPTFYQFIEEVCHDLNNKEAVLESTTS
eukprot:COSAG01_NODE_2485_length_7594_cov_36.632021_9_plen_137_part_00